MSKNRIIQFRGKTRYGHWVYGSLVVDAFGNHQIVAHKLGPKGKSQITDHYEVDPSTIGQFTGLTDRKGNKVFEGDIVVDEALNKGVVVWLTDAAQFLCDFGMDYHDIGTWATVIGNQFDNPELTNQS